MKTLLIFIFWLSSFAICQHALAEEKPQKDSASREIPLKDVFGNVSSESQPLRKLEPEYFIYRDTPENIKKYESLTSEQVAEISRKAEESYNLPIERALRSLDSSKGRLRPGFAVEGQGRQALKGVFDVLVKGNQPVSQFKLGTSISIVFFSYPAQPILCIDRIAMSKSTITISYSLISHGAMGITSALAIIPLGELGDGKYHVEMIRNHSTKRDEAGFPPVASKLEDQIICGNFEFVVGTDK